MSETYGNCECPNCGDEHACFEEHDGERTIDCDECGYAYSSEEPKVWVMTAEHWAVPGQHMEVCSTPREAARQAAQRVNIMLRNAKLEGRATWKTWEEHTARLKEAVDDFDEKAYVYIIEKVVR